ncbi:MAG: BspA family leucine-rich repeat surface protein [Bacteroides sp.]|nr:BspA family leucine-rich repeat surface protein [Bacteroides sp.]
MSEILRKIRVPLESGEVRELEMPVPSLQEHLSQLKFKWCTLAEYGAISSPDSETLYFIHAGWRLLKVMWGFATLMVCEPNRIEYIPTEKFSTNSSYFGFVLGESLTPTGYPLGFTNQYLFSNGRFLRTIRLFGVSYLKVVCYVPYNDLKITSDAPVVDLTALDTTQMKKMENMLNLGKVIELDVSGFNTLNVTTMEYMFYGCYSLKKLDLGGFDTKNVKSFSSMFEGCSSLESLNVSGWNVKSCTDVSSMFDNCYLLKSININWINTQNISTLAGMFSDCHALESLDLSAFVSKNVTQYYSMFAYCGALKTLDIRNFDFMFNRSSPIRMFYGCSSLRNLSFGKNYSNYTLDLGDCPLTHTSAMSVINGLKQCTKNPQLIFSAETYDTLTDEELALALSLGFTVVS